MNHERLPSPLHAYVPSILKSIGNSLLILFCFRFAIFVVRYSCIPNISLLGFFKCNHICGGVMFILHRVMIICNILYFVGIILGFLVSHWTLDIPSHMIPILDWKQMMVESSICKVRSACAAIGRCRKNVVSIIIGVFSLSLSPINPVTFLQKELS